MYAINEYLIAAQLEPLIPELMKSVGAAGVLIGLLFITGMVVASRTADKMEENALRWEQRYDTLRQQVEVKDQKLIEEIVPLLTRGVEVMAKFSETHSQRSGRDER